MPLYKQIKEILIEELQAADGETGRPFSTEHELVQRFHVSRAPVRQALKELANEGYVYRERAKGTFPVQELPVRPPGLELGGLVGFLRDQGLDCNSKILAVDRVFPTEKLCEILGTEPSDKVLRIFSINLSQRRNHLYGRRPIWLSRRISNRVNENLKKVDSVFVLLESEQGIFISRGDHQILRQVLTVWRQSFWVSRSENLFLVMETKLYTRND